ncbi:MAG TPA: 3-hydroxyisobutyrate dehydrogenase, partial [Alphaproteobacteria bacterium]|nr:3-hydroxyisobutyrate dehydrogenase [Alphaproteobacteria bacterium]
GNMGGPMSANMIKAGHTVTAFDLSSEALEAAAANGCAVTDSAAACAQGQDVVITMLPAGPHVRSVYGAKGEQGSVIDAVDDGTLLIDCSTIDVASARQVAENAGACGLKMVEAPVTGGVPGAVAGTLTMIVGGPKDAYELAKPYLEIVGGKVVYCGEAGAGQAVKICNNMMLAINMAGVAEGMSLIKALGIDPAILKEVSSAGSGNSWALTAYNPEPGLTEGAPANNGYKPGFTGAMLVKDTGLAIEAGIATGTPLPLGGAATQLFQLYCKAGMDQDDMSGIIRMLQGKYRG